MNYPNHPGAGPTVKATFSTLTPGSVQSPPDYPANPGPVPTVNDDVAAGIPADIATISQAFQVMEACTACGRAVPVLEFGAHVQAHGTDYNPADQFGTREFSI